MAEKKKPWYLTFGLIFFQLFSFCHFWVFFVCVHGSFRRNDTLFQTNSKAAHCLISEKYSSPHCRITIVPVGHSQTFLSTLFQERSYSIDAVSPLLKNVIELRCIIMQKLELPAGLHGGLLQGCRVFAEEKGERKGRGNCPGRTLYIVAIWVFFFPPTHQCVIRCNSGTFIQLSHGHSLIPTLYFSELRTKSQPQPLLFDWNMWLRRNSVSKGKVGCLIADRQDCQLCYNLNMARSQGGATADDRVGSTRREFPARAPLGTQLS